MVNILQLVLEEGRAERIQLLCEVGSKRHPQGLQMLRICILLRGRRLWHLNPICSDTEKIAASRMVDRSDTIGAVT